MEKRVSLVDVASEVGVSAMTVSRVLNGFPRVSERTRQRVLSAVQSLGYVPDPHMARMMRMVRERKRRSGGAMIAVIREPISREALLNSVHQYVSLPDIVARASLRGYGAEEFWLGRDGVDARRMGTILKARGIEGVIVSPQSTRLLCSGLDYSGFAAATFGYCLLSPSLHRASTNMMLGVGMAAQELVARGYRRIGLAVTRWVDERSQNTYSGAMLHFQQGVPLRDRVPILLFPETELGRSRAVFLDWLKRFRPDALISFDCHIPEWLQRAGLRIPRDVGLVVHDWTPRMNGFAGIHHRRDLVAAAAVDLVTTQLLHNERGVPEVPRQVLIPPLWVPGESIVARG